MPVSAVIALLLPACEQILEREPSPARGPLIVESGSDTPILPAPPLRQAASGQGQPVATIIVPGTDRFLGSAPGRAVALRQAVEVAGPDAISLNLVEAPLADAAKAVLGDALGLNYVIEGGASGQVTLQSSTPLGREALLEAFQTALEFNGATMSVANGLVTITPTDRAPPRFVSPADTRGFGRRIVVIPLRYVSVTEMVRLLEPIVSSGAVLRTSPARNLLMVSGNQAELDAILDAVNLFDVDILEGKSVALVRLRSASPEAVSRELRTIFEAEAGGGLEGVIDFIPNERLGSILVVTSRAGYLRDARDWITRLDATAGQAVRRAVVYPLQNRSALELGPVLTELLAAFEQTGAADGEALATEDGLLAAPGSARIVADDGANAIVVWGTELEQEQFASLIRQLDASATQVLLEATIAEVILNDELRYGIRWFFESGNFGITFSDFASGAVAPSFPGLSFLFSGGSAQIAISALASVTDVKVVSSPTLLVLDNHEAELRVGDQVPVAVRSAVEIDDPDAVVVNSIEYRDTGVILKIRPRVSETGRVIMDIEQEVSDVVDTTTSGIDSPTIAQRELRTAVAVDSGQTLALGGLIRESSSRVVTKVPLLGDIPVLGQVFRSKDDDVDRSELLILITPRVIRDASEARLVTDEFRQRLASPDQLIEGGAAPRHTLRRLLN